MFEIMNECDKLDINKIKLWLQHTSGLYLGVKHDKDKTRPHYHIFVKFSGARDIDDISKQCGVEPQYIQSIRNWKNAIAYAFHLTDNAQNDEKYQYNKECVIFSNGVNIDEIFVNDTIYKEEKTHDILICELLEKYGNCEITKRDLVDNMDAKDYNKYALQYKRMKEFRQLKIGDRQMKVMYITGPAGSGKTTLAKYMARVLNYDSFISGSGKDVLDGYDKEECIILDDLRADAFTKAELFKLTDNNTNSSVKSRYANKDISSCKLMIITSIKDPYSLYNWNEDIKETFTQFARRLDYMFLSINENGSIFECAYNKDSYNVSCSMSDYSMSDIYKIMGIEKQLGKDFMSMIYELTRKEIEKTK